MSTVPKETIEVIAQSIGISNLSPDAALALAPDVEYRMREIMQVILLAAIHKLINKFLRRYVSYQQSQASFFLSESWRLH